VYLVGHTEGGASDPPVVVAHACRGQREHEAEGRQDPAQQHTKRNPLGAKQSWDKDDKRHEAQNHSLEGPRIGKNSYPQCGQERVAHPRAGCHPPNRSEQERPSQHSKRAAPVTLAPGELGWVQGSDNPPEQGPTRPQPGAQHPARGAASQGRDQPDADDRLSKKNLPRGQDNSLPGWVL